MVAALAGAVPATAATQTTNEDLRVSINYVYAAQLGFGAYSVGGLDVNVYSLPLEYSLDDVLLDWRLRIDLPIQYGVYSFRKVVPIEDTPVKILADQKTLSAEPMLSLEIPITEPWTLSLLGAWGFGSTFGTSIRGRLPDGTVIRDPASENEVWYYTYQVGVSSLLQQREGAWTLSLGNAFVYAGTAFLQGPEQVEAYGALETGVDARHPLGFRIQDVAPDASLFFIWYYFTPSLQFSRIGEASLQVDNVYEVGLTFGTDAATPMKLPLLGNPRLGVSYRAGNDLNAVRLNFGFPF